MEETKKEEYSNKVPIVKLIILNILTFGIFYFFYWFYRNWIYLKKYAKKDIHPALRTAGILVPIYGIWLLYEQFKWINELVNKEKIETWSAGGLLAVFVILKFVTFRISMGLSENFDLFLLFIDSIVLTTIAILPLIGIQGYLNKYWDKTQHNVKSSFTPIEIILASLGAIVWMFFILVGLLWGE